MRCRDEKRKEVGGKEKGEEMGKEGGDGERGKGGGRISDGDQEEGKERRVDG